MKSTWPLLWIMLGLAMASCRSSDFLYYRQPQTGQVYSFTHKVLEISGNPNVDLLWVIDNSGSMDSSQKNVIRNTDVFMQNFTRNPGLQWRMGLISTTQGEAPYIGLDPSDRLDSTTTDPVSRFQAAVGRLGTYGSGYEMTFGPTLDALSSHPDFLRKNAILAMIIVSDVYDQSMIGADEFLRQIAALKGGLKNVIIYGVLGAEDDFGCPLPAGENEWKYAGSNYEQVITATHGKVYKLCDTDFGSNLADLGKDLVTRVESPRLFLQARPKPSTIHVYYKGVEIPGGAPENGGIWTYDYDSNSLVFSSLDFTQDTTSEIRVTFEADDGF